jgi:hypothetical protein
MNDQHDGVVEVHSSNKKKIDTDHRRNHKYRNRRHQTKERHADDNTSVSYYHTFKVDAVRGTLNSSYPLDMTNPFVDNILNHELQQIVVALP